MPASSKQGAVELAATPASVAVELNAAAAADPAALIAAKPQPKHSFSTKSTATGAQADTATLGALFKSRAAHALLILGCIVFLKANTLFIQVGLQCLLFASRCSRVSRLLFTVLLLVAPR